ncbi:hypothetical protein AB1N83_004032 [Pleurotus pulmonarius]
MLAQRSTVGAAIVRRYPNLQHHGASSDNVANYGSSESTSTLQTVPIKHGKLQAIRAARLRHAEHNATSLVGIRGLHVVPYPERFASR